MSFQRLADIHTIVVHCSATPQDMDIGAKEIRRWHIGRRFADIGYHYVLRRNGEREIGRSVTTVGAHARGHNRNSIGICMVGGTDQYGTAKENFTKSQKASLKALIIGIKWVLPNIQKIVGHRDLPGVKKDCPSFDVASFLKEYNIG